MNSNEVYDALERVKATPGKNDKVELLKELLEDELFRYVVVQALDPRITFGVAKKTLDKVEATTAQNGIVVGWDMTSLHVPAFLDALARRDIAGNSAVERLQVAYAQMNTPSWNVLKRILTKTLDIGATESSVNKARPNTIWTFDCMLAHPYEAKRIEKFPVAGEPKLDGVRALGFVENGVCSGFFSRSGQLFASLDHLRPALEQIVMWASEEEIEIPSFIIDGEVTSGIFNETISAVRSGDALATDAVFNAFDLIPLQDWEDGITAVYTERRADLISLLQNQFGRQRHDYFKVVPMDVLHSDEEITEHYARQRAAKLEGSIIKPLHHRYERKRSYNWLKIKAKETADIHITGFLEGEGKYVGMLGKVTTDWVNAKGEPVRVGGGWSDEQRREIWENQVDYLGRMIEVEYHEITPDNSLRHPRFVRWRDDKSKGIAAE